MGWIPRLGAWLSRRGSKQTGTKPAVDAFADTFRQIEWADTDPLADPMAFAEGTIDGPPGNLPDDLRATTPMKKLELPGDTEPDLNATLERPRLTDPPMVLEPQMFEEDIPCFADECQIYAEFGNTTDLDVGRQMQSMVPEIDWKKK